MLIWENIKLALAGILGNKMRSVLTMLGIIIGIGSVIAIMTVSSSLTSSITSTFADMGANNITVGVRRQSEKQETRENGMRFGKSNRNVSLDEEDRITDEMLEELQKKFPTQISSFAMSESVGSATVSVGESSANITVNGINQGYYDSEEINLVTGRYLTEDDVNGDKAVIMISDRAAEALYGEGTSYEEVLGRRLLVDINNLYYSFYIVGIYEYEEDSESFSSESEEDTETPSYIPISTAKEKLHSDSGYERFTLVTLESVTDVTTFATTIKNYMNNKFYADNDDYQISTTTMSSMTESLSETIGTTTIAIAFIAGISLLVGGIGVMNIMLVSVTERTSEIGLKKAIGAKKRRILWQFLTEASVLTSLGGVMGVAGGVVMARLISRLTSTPTAATTLPPE